MVVSTLSAILTCKQYACVHAGQGAVYTYDPVGNFERVGYSCQASFIFLVKLTHLGVCGVSVSLQHICLFTAGLCNATET